jgi:hypothetical protein
VIPPGNGPSGSVRHPRSSPVSCRKIVAMSYYRPHTIVTAMPANTTQRAAKNSRKSIISTPFNTGRYDPRRLPWRMAGRIRYVTFEAPELFPIVSARILHAKDWGFAGGDLLRRDIRPRVSQTSAVFRGARRRLPRARSSVIHNRCAVSYPAACRNWFCRNPSGPDSGALALHLGAVKTLLGYLRTGRRRNGRKSANFEWPWTISDLAERRDGHRHRRE